MNRVLRRRFVPEVGGDFVVFLTSRRINRRSKPRSWLPVYRAMGRIAPADHPMPDEQQMMAAQAAAGCAPVG